MRKFIRLALTCTVLAAALFTPASAVPPARADGRTYIVEISMMPKEVVCIGEPTPVSALFYFGPAEEDRSKHATIPGGTIVLRGMVGTIKPPSFPAKTIPGDEIFTYTGKSFGREQLQATLNTRTGTLATSPMQSFDVRECNYQLSIDAKVIVHAEGTLITVLLKSKGKIFVSETEVKGTLPIDLRFEAQSEDPATECKVDPEVKTTTLLDVTGARSSGFWTNNDLLNLNFTYANFEQIPRANVKCYDKTKHYKIKDFPLPMPSKYNPKTDLPTSVEIKNFEPLTLPLGKDGSVTFKVTKLPGSGGK